VCFASLQKSKTGTGKAVMIFRVNIFRKIYLERAIKLFSSMNISFDISSV